MSNAQLAIAVSGPRAMGRVRRSLWRGPQGAEVPWAIAFLLPYAAVLLGFVAYPVAFGLWLGHRPALYLELLASPHYATTVINTLLLVGVGVNVTLFLALLLSGFFIGQSRWVKALLVLYMLPWALPVLPAFLSLHWMLIGYGGFLNSALALAGIDGPIWFNSYWLALSANILAYIWKWLPFWTLVFLAGRMAIPRDIDEAAAVDGASGLSRFAFITFPLLSNLYIVCTLLCTLWTMGDFTTAYFVSSGAPALSTDVLATFGFRTAFDQGYPALGVAAVMSALPVLIPVGLVLIRRLQTSDMQL